MIEMPTTRGLTIRLDDEDAELVADLSWHAVAVGDRFYAHARLPGHWTWRLLMHRLIMGAAKGTHVHHKNGDGLDNQRSNLEVLTPSRHRTEHVRGTAGVYFDKTQDQFRAAVRIDHQRIDLGLHANKATAERAVWLARELLPGLSPAERVDTATLIKAAAKRHAVL